MIDPVGVESRDLAGVDHYGRQALLDDGRALNTLLGAQRLAIIDGGRYPAAVEKRAPFSTRPGGFSRSAQSVSRRRFARGAGLDADCSQDRILIARGVGVDFFVQRMEVIDQ